MSKVLVASCTRGFAGRGIHTHLVINSESGLLGDSDFSACDFAARICPTGALILKREGYPLPIGERRSGRYRGSGSSAASKQRGMI